MLDLLLGSVPGPMGATNILVIIACGVFLIVRKAVNWRTPVFFLLTYGALSALFPRIEGSGFDALCYELFSGMIVFGAFFMLSEPVTSPKRDFGKLLYSMAAGIIVFLFGHFGGFEDGFVYAIIIMNVFTPVFDTVCENALHLYRNKEKLKESIESDIKKAAQKPAPAVVRKHKKAENEDKAAADAPTVDEISVKASKEPLSEENSFEKGEISSEETEKIQEENKEAIADKELAPQEDLNEAIVMNSFDVLGAVNALCSTCNSGNDSIGTHSSNKFRRSKDNRIAISTNNIK